jgi:large repetitive protein
MRRTIACTSMLITLLIVSLASSWASAETVVINYADRGWYDPTGFHDTDILNYGVGDVRGPGCDSCRDDIRNFLVFDLSGVAHPIASAKLALFVPGPLSIAPPGYKSFDPSENYELHNVTTSIASLVAGTGGVAAHADLGDGVVYGSRTMTAADNGREVEITLNSNAIAALDAATGLIAIGGSLTTLDGLANDEYTFAWTSLGTETTQLRLTLVPEPATLMLLGIGAISLLGYRKSRSHG